MLIRRCIVVAACALCRLANISSVEAEQFKTGLVFVNGKLIDGPYEVEFANSQVSINSLTLNLGEENTLPAPDRSEDFRRRAPGQFSGRGRRGRFGNNGGRPQPLWQEFQQSSPRSRGQARPGDEFKPSDNHYYQITDTLGGDGFVVVFDNARPFYLTSTTQKSDFAVALLDRQNGQNLDSLLLQMGIVREQERWKKLINSTEPDTKLTAKLEDMLKTFESSEAANYAQINAMRRLENASYPLTVLGMLLGAIALGHNLQWSAAGMTSEQSIGFLKKALFLILAMSLLDLTWTIMSSQAGQMREVNPFASSYIDSPWKLILFKLIATTGACGILYSLRESAKVQQATWWMCLVCVLLTFRWIMLNSFLA